MVGARGRRVQVRTKSLQAGVGAKGSIAVVLDIGVYRADIGPA
jgi:hypothetical protein